MITDLPFIPTNYSYPQSIHNCPVGIDHVDTSCSKNGFTKWEIEGANGSSLPPGMTLNYYHGSIHGIRLSSMKETMLTISAIYSIDYQIYSCTINITVFGCDFPSQIAILKE